jgi:hypothetical protein
MKMMKVALLGGAALAVTSAGAFADELSNLKSSMESMTIATPVADAPEGATITWAGFVRQALTFRDDDGADSGLDLNGGRARLIVDATTPTSVGDVSFHGVFGASQGQPRGGWDISWVEYWGTWQMTPELAFQGGRMFTGGQGQGETYGNTVGLSPSFATTTDNALQLNYASGPFSFIIGVENGDDPDASASFDATPDFYASMGWSGDMVSFGLQGNYVMNDAPGYDDSYQIGANVNFNLSDAIGLRIAGVFGQEECTIAGCVAGYGGAAPDGRGDYFGVVGRIRANVTEATMLELSGGYVDADAFDRFNVNAGMYWTPAAPLTIGLQGDYTSTDLAGPGSSLDSMSASLVTWWRF